LVWDNPRGNNKFVLVKVNIVHPKFVPKSIVMHELGGNRFSWTIPVILLRSSDWNAHVHDIPPPPEDPPLMTHTLYMVRTTLLSRSTSISLQAGYSKINRGMGTTMGTTMGSRAIMVCSKILFQCNMVNSWCSKLKMSSMLQKYLQIWSILVLLGLLLTPLFRGCLFMQDFTLIMQL
jgi:hypothetical protein